MLQLELRDGQEPQEAQIYEELSNIIKIFRKILILSDSVLLAISTDADCSLTLSEMKSLTQAMHLYIHPYDYPVAEQSLHQNTYYRFICRLIETVGPHRNRNYSTKDLFKLNFHYASDLESTVSAFKVDKNIGKMLKKMHFVIQKFIGHCEHIIFNGGPSLASVKKQITEESQVKHIKVGHRTFSGREETNFSKVMTLLNRRFSAFGSLDVDFGAFKAAFFRSRNEKEEFYQQYYDRNLPIFREISKYSRTFLQFLKRKEQRDTYFRKNRFRQFRENRHDSAKPEVSNFNQDVERSLNFIQKNAKKAVTKFEDHRQLAVWNQEEECPGLAYPQQQAEGKNPESQSHKRKTSYQMKTVFLTLHQQPPAQPAQPYLNLQANPKNCQKMTFFKPSRLQSGENSFVTNPISLYPTNPSFVRSRLNDEAIKNEPTSLRKEERKGRKIEALLQHTHSIFERSKECREKSILIHQKYSNLRRDAHQRKNNIRISYLNHRSLFKRDPSDQPPLIRPMHFELLA